MKKQIDPKPYGLPSRTVLLQETPASFTIVINRKTRVIMKDAKAILKKVETIKKTVGNACVAVQITAPVCSKSISFLSEKGVNVIKK